eukprot:7559332-Pyramimonas_sp.AAC.1
MHHASGVTASTSQSLQRRVAPCPLPGGVAQQRQFSQGFAKQLAQAASADSRGVGAGMDSPENSPRVVFSTSFARGPLPGAL